MMVPMPESIHNGHLMAAALKRHHDDPVLYLGDIVLTGSEMAARISQYTQAFEAFGAGPDQASALLALNRPEVLSIELAALLILTVLGLSHAHRWGSLIHPVIAGPHGLLTPVAFSGVLALTAVAIFSYNGYANSVNFSEETAGPSRNVARAILWSLVITVIAELIPLTAIIVGTPSLAIMTGSPVPLEYFIDATSNHTVYTIVSVGIVLAILNAVIAIVLAAARILYSSARDRAWPGPVNQWISFVHPRFKSPWLPAVLTGVLGVVQCLTVSLTTLVNLTGASLVADYALIAIAALVARPVGATAHGSYRMPLWPLPPLLALASLGYVFTQQTRPLLEATLITISIGFVYWAVVILPSAEGPGSSVTRLPRLLFDPVVEMPCTNFFWTARKMISPAYGSTWPPSARAAVSVPAWRTGRQAVERRHRRGAAGRRAYCRARPRRAVPHDPRGTSRPVLRIRGGASPAVRLFIGCP